MLSSLQDISNLVSGNLVIALRHFWYHLKGLLKGFWWPFRLLKSVKYSWSYGPNKVCDSLTLVSSSPLRVQIAKSSRYNKMMFSLSKEPLPWLDLQESASGLPIDHSG